MSGLLQQVLEKASALPEDLQDIVEREWLDDIARCVQKSGEPSDLPPLPLSSPTVFARSFATP